MIKVSYRLLDGNVESLLVSGHADYAKSDEFDVVCAIVSTIVIGGLNAIIDDKNYLISLKSGYSEVVVNNYNDHDNIVLNTIITQLKTLESKYENNIKVKQE